MKHIRIKEYVQISVAIHRKKKGLSLHLSQSATKTMFFTLSVNFPLLQGKTGL
jgi:hypothetical protein